MVSIVARAAHKAPFLDLIGLMAPKPACALQGDMLQKVACKAAMEGPWFCLTDMNIFDTPY